MNNVNMHCDLENNFITFDVQMSDLYNLHTELRKNQVDL